MEERSHNGLFASYLASLTPETSVVELPGTYDPTEQLWRDNGSVVASGCIGDNPCLDECKPYLPFDECWRLCCD